MQHPSEIYTLLVSYEWEILYFLSKPLESIHLNKTEITKAKSTK